MKVSDIPDLRDRIKKGAIWEGYVAASLAFAGFKVVMEPKRVREDAECPYLFEDTIDLMVQGIKVQVKSRSIQFNKVADFPFNSILICRYDGKEIPTTAYIMVSQVTGGMIASLPDSKRFIGTQEDKVRGYSYKAVYAKKESFVDFATLCSWLEETILHGAVSQTV
jgi:hypothetical protein